MFILESCFNIRVTRKIYDSIFIMTILNFHFLVFFMVLIVWIIKIMVLIYQSKQIHIYIYIYIIFKEDYYLPEFWWGYKNLIRYKHFHIIFTIFLQQIIIGKLLLVLIWICSWNYFFIHQLQPVTTYYLWFVVKILWTYRFFMQNISEK